MAHARWTLQVGKAGLLAFLAIMLPGCGLWFLIFPPPEPPCEEGGAIGTPTVSYSQDVIPILMDSGCMASGCHGGLFPSSEYRLDSYAASFEPGTEATALGICPIVPGDPDASFLIEKLGPSPRSGTRMPLIGEALTEEEIELIATWVREGAPDN